MQIENDYDKEVCNGDIGFVEASDLDLGEMTIGIDGRSVTYAFGELDQVVLVFATTIHKSQGFEYPAIHSHHDAALYECNAICFIRVSPAAGSWLSCSYKSRAQIVPLNRL